MIIYHEYNDNLIFFWLLMQMTLQILVKTAHDPHTKLRLPFYDTPPPDSLPNIRIF